MNCNELVELITDYLEGCLSAEDVGRFEDHLAECPACLLYLEQMQGVIKTVGQFEENTSRQRQKRNSCGSLVNGKKASSPDYA